MHAVFPQRAFQIVQRENDFRLANRGRLPRRGPGRGAQARLADGVVGYVGDELLRRERYQTLDARVVRLEAGARQMVPNQLVGDCRLILVQAAYELFEVFALQRPGRRVRALHEEARDGERACRATMAAGKDRRCAWVISKKVFILWNVTYDRLQNRKKL